MTRKRPLLTLFLLLLLACAASAKSQYSRLHPSSQYWDKDTRAPTVHIVRIAGNKKLAAVGDTLYMLNARHQVSWTWSSNGPPFTDVPIIDRQSTIYVIGFDLMWIALDSETGKVKWKGTACGRAVYSQIGIYKDNIYFVVTDMDGYRERPTDKKSIKDRLTICKGNSILWEKDIPAGARIRIQGQRLMAVIRRKWQKVQFPIRVPAKFGEPIGKVSVLAD